MGCLEEVSNLSRSRLGICRSILLSYGVFQGLSSLRYLALVTVKIGHASLLAYDGLVVQVFKGRDGPGGRRAADAGAICFRFVSQIACEDPLPHGSS